MARPGELLRFKEPECPNPDSGKLTVWPRVIDLYLDHAKTEGRRAVAI